ncbi:Metal-dependent hydrolase, composite domain protein [Kalmanozyma brasiliensis GHG001]|uniref:Amidohydrolase-related domain-containing protein n=1 Tax=Kalmanozyma brasiliensis (strain GHG001) TaxID=1365824 RepID=V5EPY5_KALBG|nr:Metal-dependent hydrolase, composite domain protein [Kalmanozyma brasiliensis GHG001]EST07165.1 Metal-dependent hydrolase, composite domain protein [Kalmanozyma brasiliensis GHG001]
MSDSKDKSRADAMLPSYASPAPVRKQRLPLSLRSAFLSLLGFVTLVYYVGVLTTYSGSQHHVYQPSPHPHIQSVFAASLDKCDAIAAPVGPPADFHKRTRSDRAEKDLPDVLIRNATLWTGNDGGREVLHERDVLLSQGLIKRISHTKDNAFRPDSKVKVVDAAGRWVTPGLVDMHVHLSVGALPAMSGDDDVNSIGKNTNPYLRTIDAMNQHDVSFRKSIAGGITTGLVLPGSANSMGGQAFPIKYRQTSSHLPLDRVIEPPTSLARLGQGKGDVEKYDLETGLLRNDSSSSWRYMKMACGENARRVYKMTRMDEAWDFRRTFAAARSLKLRQDAFCDSARSPRFAPTTLDDATFPDDLEHEALVALLRGKVKLNTHCYTQVDFEAFVRHSNEFEFEVAAFHHAHESYLVPDLLRQTYGNVTPAIAIFSTNANYKLESYFGSPFAGAILASQNITPVYKSDHPVTDSRRILNQAAQAHHFGLEERLAMRSVISAPAERLGLDHRLGYVREGWDADVVVWNTHPLRLGATPVEVISDGVPQLGPHAPVPRPSLPKGKEIRERKEEVAAQPAPKSGNFSADIRKVKESYDQIITFDALAFPSAKEPTQNCTVFINVSERFHRRANSPRIRSSTYASGSGTLVVAGGRVLCSGEACSSTTCPSTSSVTTIDAHGGVVLPGLISYGSNLGLTDIVSEPEASDGFSLDPLSSSTPATQLASYLANWPVARAVDGLQFGGHDLIHARASGVTRGIVFPQSDTFFSGVSVKFDTGAENVLTPGAVVQEEVAVHVTLTHDKGGPSIGEQLGLLRQLLTKPSGVWERVTKGEMALVVTALRADHIASLLRLKDSFPKVNLVISGAAEGHLVADEIAKRNVGVLLIPQTWPRTFDEIRGLSGPPLTRETTLSSLLRAGVRVALKIEEAWMAGNLLWDATRAALETDGLLDREQIVQLVSGGIDDVLGLKSEEAEEEFVVYDGDPFEYGAKVLAVHSRRGTEVVEV